MAACDGVLGQTNVDQSAPWIRVRRRYFAIAAKLCKSPQASLLFSQNRQQPPLPHCTGDSTYVYMCMSDQFKRSDKTLPHPSHAPRSFAIKIAIAMRPARHNPDMSDAQTQPRPWVVWPNRSAHCCCFAAENLPAWLRKVSRRRRRYVIRAQYTHALARLLPHRDDAMRTSPSQSAPGTRKINRNENDDNAGDALFLDVGVGGGGMFLGCGRMRRARAQIRRIRGVFDGPCGCVSVYIGSYIYVPRRT